VYYHNFEFVITQRILPYLTFKILQIVEQYNLFNFVLIGNKIVSLPVLRANEKEQNKHWPRNRGVQGIHCTPQKNDWGVQVLYLYPPEIFDTTNIFLRIRSFWT